MSARGAERGSLWAVVRAASYACLLAAVASDAHAQTRRAVVVGIGAYSAAPPPAPGSPAAASPFAARRASDLANAVLDAESFAALLEGRFGFASADVALLTDADATRDGILGALREHLVLASEPGDTAVFYFVGHGSRIVSSHPDTRGGLDQTLVPFDSASGARDIWDKELRSILNDVLDAGAGVTAIFGSCYSGDVTRAGGPASRGRPSAPWIETDAVTLYPEVGVDPRPAPGDRGALVLSAARPDQLAHFVPKTVRVAGGERELPRGLFSWHLDEVLRTVAVDEPAERVFLRVRARMRAEPYRQEPTLEPWGDPETLARPLFGAPPAELDGAVVVGVVALEDGAAVLDAGLALGLAPGCELELVGAGEDAIPVRLRVTEVLDLRQARAAVVGGDAAAVRPGLDLFRVTRWVATDEARLRVHVPPTVADRRAIVAAATALAAREDLTWVLDPTETAPSHVARFDGAQWRLESRAGTTTLGPALEPDAVVAALAGHDRPALFVQLPPPADAVAALERVAERSAVALSGAADAHYQLVARFQPDVHDVAGGGYELALCAPIVPGALADGGELPARTAWWPAGGSWLVERPLELLRSDIQQLARVRGWLTLTAPPDDGRFPYRLVVESPPGAAPGEPHVAANGEPYAFRLEADPARLGRGIQSRYIYLLGLSGDDASCSLLWSSSGRLPRAGGSLVDPEYPQAIELDGVGPIVSTGNGSIDTFVAISTRTAITDVGALSWAPIYGEEPLPAPDAVRSGGDLGSLLGALNTGVRAAGTVPDAWSLSRARVRGGDVLERLGSYELWLHRFQLEGDDGARECPNRFVAPRAGTLRITASAADAPQGFALNVDAGERGLYVARDPALDTAAADGSAALELVVDEGDAVTVTLAAQLTADGPPFVPVALTLTYTD